MSALATNPFVPGDHVIKTSHDDPDAAVVIDSGEGPSDETVTVVYAGQLENGDLLPDELMDNCEEAQIKQYSYTQDELERAG